MAEKIKVTLGNINVPPMTVSMDNVVKGGNAKFQVPVLKGKDGDSAYQIAVANGFEGTEKEWLESLKGQDGKDGEQGIQGNKGDKGDKGDDGLYVGNVEPTDDSIDVWVDLDDETPPTANDIIREATQQATIKATANVANYVNEQDYQNQEQVKEIASISVVELTDTNAILLPNVFYVFPTGEEINVTFAEGEKGKYNEYMFQFTSGDNTRLNVPDGVKWIGDSKVQPNTTYQISVVNNLAVMGGVSNE